MRNSTHYSTVEQQTTELFTPLTFGSKKSTWQNRSTTRCQATKLLLIFFGIVSVLGLTLCGFNNLVVDYTTTTPINTTTTTPISTTTTTPINTTTTTPISTTTTPEETTLLSDLDYDDTTVQLLRTPETRSGDVVITNKTIVINEVNNSLTVFD